MLSVAYSLYCFQMQRRTYLPKYKIQGNYYPITTQIYIEDNLFRATLHTAYSHGASSQSSGKSPVFLLHFAL